MSLEFFRLAAKKIAHWFPVVLFGCALYIVHIQLKGHDLIDILSSLRAMPASIIGAAFMLTLINYLVLAGYDGLALRFTGYKQIPVLKMIAAAMLSYAISNNTGHAWLAGGSIRYRFYSKWGVSGWDVIKISLFQTITYLLGALSLGLAGSLMLPYYLTSTSQEPSAIPWLAVICAATLLVYWAIILIWRKPLTIKGIELALPSPMMTLWQTVVASVDIVLSSTVLWVLLQGDLDISFGAFIVVFVVAQVVGVISQVPGGIGVFESAFLWLMSAIDVTNQHIALVSALLLFRAIYYFLPLFSAGVGLLGFEVYSRRRTLAAHSRLLTKILATLVPQIYSLLLLIAGGILLVSGAIPANINAMQWLRELIPLPVVELSHLAGSLIGLLLVFLARGIRLKLDAAWYGSLLLLGLGIIASLLKGFDWREAFILLCVLLLFLPCHSYFQRQSKLLGMTFSKQWLASITIVLTGSLWLGFFAYRDIEYANELWWQFSYEGNAPRFLRATLLIIVVTVIYGLSRLLSVAPPRIFAKPSSHELIAAKHIVTQSYQTQGFLALLGDKHLFWNKERDAFIMFAVTPNYWIAMGDPIGNAASIDDLLWAFYEQADNYGAKSIFYQISEDNLSCYLDLGLSLYKFGEEALVDLSAFSLKGKRHEALRSASNKFNKMGYSFEILTADAVEQAMPVLRQISDAWLTKKILKKKDFH